MARKIQDFFFFFFKAMKHSDDSVTKRAKKYVQEQTQKYRIKVVKVGCVLVVSFMKDRTAENR